jgi:hypothetical protein
MSQKSHWTQPTMYKYFYFKTEIKTKVDSYMPCEAMAHSPKSKANSSNISHLSFSTYPMHSMYHITVAFDQRCQSINLPKLFGITAFTGVYQNTESIKHVMVTGPYQIDQNCTVSEKIHIFHCYIRLCNTQHFSVMSITSSEQVKFHYMVVHGRPQ